METEDVPSEQLPEAVEAAAYYLVAEARTSAASPIASRRSAAHWMS